MSEIKDPYIQGQEDLINNIKDECKKILEDPSKNGDNIMLDVLFMMKKLKPIEK